MIFSKIIKNINEISNIPEFNDLDIRGIAYDSRKVKPGFIFVALIGAFLDGHKFEENTCHVICKFL